VHCDSISFKILGEKVYCLCVSVHTSCIQQISFIFAVYIGSSGGIL
jgi:hypothetical protein